MWTNVILAFTCLFFFFTSLESAKRNPQTGHCALFVSSDTRTSSFLKLGKFDIEHDVDISMEVFPHVRMHNGILLSAGSSDSFKYYEWKTKSVTMQYFVLEFMYSAVVVLLKANGTKYMHTLEIYRTWPEPYDIADAKWHTVKIQRFRNQALWKLTLDNLNASKPVDVDTNVMLEHTELFLGGRPEYTSYEFNGIIRNVNVNGRAVDLQNTQARGNARVLHCTSPEISQFITDNEYHIHRPRRRPF